MMEALITSKYRGCGRGAREEDTQQRTGGREGGGGGRETAVQISEGGFWFSAEGQHVQRP